jgi:hypothetical protein
MDGKWKGLALRDRESNPAFKTTFKSDQKGPATRGKREVTGALDPALVGASP